MLNEIKKPGDDRLKSLSDLKRNFLPNQISKSDKLSKIF